MDNNELNLNELEEISGGIQHKVTATDTLIRIANHYGIKDWHKIREWNPHINKGTNMIRTGEYLWIKK